MVKFYHLTMSHDNEATEMTKDEPKDSECCGFWCKFFLSLFGITFLCTGIIMTYLWPQIFGDIMKNNLQLKNNSQTYKYWQQIPAPLYMSVYLFNWTNPEATTNKGAKPILQQLGPYVFKENRTKINPIFNNDNNTITYMVLKSWKFEPTLSNGSLSDQITTVNIILNILGEKLRTINNYWLYVLINKFLKFSLVENTYITKTAGEFIFDGYDDPLLDIAIKLKPYISINIPFNKVGWFYGMNMSSSTDGVINMFTGVDDIEKLGIVHSVNYTEKLNVFDKDCNLSNASTGDVWPKHTALQPNMSIYIPNISSTITLTSKKSTSINGMKGVEFVAESDVFNNSCYNPESEHLLPGVRPLRLLGNDNPPLYLSFPHFYLADSSYRESICGMNPNQTLHEFKIILDSDYSIPLHVAARLQFNVKLNTIKKLKIMKNLPNVFLPVFWFTESFEIPRDLCDQLWIVKNILLNVMPYIWLMIIILGSLMLVLSTYLWVS